MNDPAPGQPTKPNRWRNGCLIALGIVGGLAVLGALLDPNAEKPAPADPNNAIASNVDGLREAMKPIGSSRMDFALALPAEARTVDIEAAAKAQCSRLPVCGVYGWTDPAQLPGAWPMLDRELAALSFRYALNRNTGYEQIDWFCGSPGAKPGCTTPGTKQVP